MTDPYRSAGLTCPECRGPLREYQKRYVCDACDGILIGFDDFKSAVADLRDEVADLAYADDERTETLCPLCEKPLITCKMTVVLTTKKIKVRQPVLRCDHDGVWLAHGTLADVFARAPRWYGGGPRPNSPQAVGLDGLPSGMRSTGAAASDGLRISDWRNRPRRRSPTLTPINAYQDLTLMCPACPTTKLAFMGDRYACSSCNGSFVQNAALIGMVADITHAVWEMPAAGTVTGKRECPVCAQAMTVETSEGVTIDRCSDHGIWFDGGELAAVLEHAGMHSLRGWLKRLFT